MSYDLIVSSQAQEQLWEIAKWYADTSHSIQLGVTWHDGILQAIRSLTENPFRCGLAHESDKFPFEVRELLYGSGRRKTHRALYRVVENRIEVVAIRHHAQRDIGPDDIQLP